MIALDVANQWPIGAAGGLGAAFAALMKMVMRLTNDQRRAEQTLRNAETALRAEFNSERRRMRTEFDEERVRLRSECAEDRAGDRERITSLEARVRELEGAPRRRTP